MSQHFIKNSIWLAADKDVSASSAQNDLSSFEFKRKEQTFIAEVSTWERPEDALIFASRIGLSEAQLTNSGYLRNRAKLPPEQGGVGINLSGLNAAIKNRWSGSISNFKKWMGHKVVRSTSTPPCRAEVMAWKEPSDALNFAEGKGIARKDLLNISYMRKHHREISNAILYRFSKMSKFQDWMGEKPKPHLSKVVASWKTRNDAIEFAESLGLSPKQLGDYMFLTKQASLTPDKGGIGRPLWGITLAVLSRFSSWQNFRIFLGVQDEKLTSFPKLVNSWSGPLNAADYAVRLGLSTLDLANLHTSSVKEKLPNVTGTEAAGYTGLCAAINQRFGGKDGFLKWLGFEVDLPFFELVKGWKSPQDAKDWACKNEISDELLYVPSSLLNLQIQSATAERPLSGLVSAIRQIHGSWSNFNRWMGRESRTLHRDEVEKWSIPEDALKFAISLGITKYQLTSPYFLTDIAPLPPSLGGIGRGLNQLHDAVVSRFGSFPQFRAWMGIGEIGRNERFIRNVFESTEAQYLASLASELGEAALAEFICAKYQDRFRYTPAFVENLRKYLGEIEIAAISGSEHIPTGLLSIKELRHLHDALFNHYRDKYQGPFIKGLEVVEGELHKCLERAEGDEQRQFVHDLIRYFRAVDAIPHPERLKDQIKGHGEYPAKHQKIAVQEIIDKRSILLADEMGGGKTGSAIAGFETLKDLGKAKRALIVCPAQVLDVWRTALSDGPEGYFKEGCPPKVVFLEGPNKDWNKATESEFAVISIESTGRGQNGEFTLNQLENLNADYLIVDESHNLKNPNGSDTERIFHLSQTESIRRGHLVLMSGTPAPNTVRDIAAQIRLLYAGREPIEGLDITDIRNLSKEIMHGSSLLVRNFLVRRMLRRMTEDCLPVKCDFTREIVSAELSPIERSHYEAVVGSPYFSAMEKLGALRRQCLEAETKYELLSASVGRALERPKYQNIDIIPKIIIAENSFAKGITRDHNDLRREEIAGSETYLASRLINELGERVMIYVLDGKNSHRRDQILNDFKCCTRPAVLFTLVPVIGQGLNLSYISDGILLSPSMTASNEEQLFRRMLRKGQTQHVYLQILSLSNTVEEGILEYAIRKNQIVKGLINGRPLTRLEKEILSSNERQVNEGGIIAYEMLSMREKALWVLSRMIGKGKDTVKDFLSSHNGKFAKDFAAGYPLDEETSYPGNTARLTAALIDELNGDKSCNLADIACGCRTMERMFHGHPNIQVHSTDINEVALEMGSQLLNGEKTVRPDEVRAMDELPYSDASKDIAVLSLALSYTKHNLRQGDIGLERIRALSELNRILKLDGFAILNFPEKTFNDKTSFLKFCQTIEREFGFELKVDLSGLAMAPNRTGKERFQVWTASFRKIGVANNELSCPQSWIDLKLKKATLEFNESRRHRVLRKEGEKVGYYHDTFTIVDNEVNFHPYTARQKDVLVEHKTAENEYRTLEQRLYKLIADYGSILNIPEHLLLSISLSEVSTAKQYERDNYFDILLKIYGGVSKVPIEKISSLSNAILIRGKSKKGPFLCLARIDRTSNKPCGYGRRYFYDIDLQ